jgi:DNA/RNA-binding domain of Phe-tRNA-synthetase-like protein
VSVEPPVNPGWVAPAVAEELPGLALAWCAFDARPGPSRPEARARLRALSDRYRGAQAIALRRQAIPHAYRVLFRHIGIDPDVRRIPVEAAVLERMRLGGFQPRNLVDDALLVATVETGVGVWALDAGRFDGDPGVAAAGGRLVVADGAGRTLAELFSQPAPEHGVTAATRRVALYAVLAAGVPDIAAEEALWTAWEIMCA